MAHEPTKPRGPVAAMYNSPGTKYHLPGLVGYNQHDPRSVHQRLPSYSFGVRHGGLRDEAGPGPCYLPPTNVYRDGKDGTPQYSLYGRQKVGTQFSAPGPGAYSPGDATGNTQQRRAPAYSISGRQEAFRTDATPGPNTYGLDPMLGKTVRSQKRSGQSYSLSGRGNIGGFDEDLQKTPGPGTYGLTPISSYKTSTAAFSLGGRHGMPGDGTQKPGPGAHSPEGSYGHSRRGAPSFSFGIRHSEFTATCITKADMD